MRFYVDTIAKNLWFDLRWSVERIVAQRTDPAAVAFYERMLAEAYEPEQLIGFAPKQRLVYVAVPKVAHSTIRNILGEIIGTRSRSLRRDHHRKYANPRGPRRIGIRAFYRLAIDPDVLRFAFVRNPYDRLVSCWADKFQNKPLVPGDPQVEKYLAGKDRVNPGLPEGRDQTLSFADFARFATATNTQRIDHHWQLQTDILNVPGLSLNFIGKYESLDRDFGRIFDHVGATPEIRERLRQRINPSQRSTCASYYTPELADLVYRAYEQDFDRLGYPRAMPS